jgi:gamma-glutamyltranspeptidase/glutathione hydrolase
LGIAALVVAAAAAPPALADEPAAVQRAPSSLLPHGPARAPAAAHKAAIASAYPLASQAGQEILAAGGNAFDAAVAVSAALAVVEPTSSGLGGGGFYLLHRQSDGFETMLDAREKAPGAASRDMYLDKAGNPVENASIYGALSSAIPGEPAAFEYLARKYGKLPLKRSLQPAIRLARDGFPLYERLQGAIRYKQQVLLRSPEAARAFLGAGGAVPELGASIKQPDLANTLEAIADQGAKGFYTGRIAEELVNGVRADGGIWTLKDLAAYQVVERKPLIGEYHGARIVSASPPSSGGVALLDALNILSGFDMRRYDSATRKHLVIEAMRRAYRDRAIYHTPRISRFWMPRAIALPRRSPSTCSSARASCRPRRACSSTTPWMIFPPSPADRMNLGWWAPRPMPSRRTSAASPAWLRPSSRPRRV